MLSIENVNLFNKIVLIRSDFNVPVKNGKILSDIKIICSLKTIKYSIDSGAYVIICSHLGNPNGIIIDELSLEPIRKYLEKKLKINIILKKDYINGIKFKNKNEVILLENVRFNKGEIENDDELSKKYSNLCDIFVMDAFASTHRINSSTYGIAKFSKISCAGFLLIKEYNFLSKILNNIKEPLTSIVGGAKISSKIKVIKTLSNISDKVYVGGGIANNIMFSKKINIGKSLIEYDSINETEKLLNINNIIIPCDVRVSNDISKNSISKLKNIYEINNNDIILDIGDESVKNIINNIKKSNTVIWSGPIGMFEIKNFSYGTKSILNFICDNKDILSIMGGGDTLFSLIKFNCLNKISYFSTGGGAFLKFIENRTFYIFDLLNNKNL